MRVLALLALAGSLFAGCLSNVPSAPVENLTNETVPIVNETIEPIVQEMRGHITLSQLGPLAHRDPETEMRIADYQREGFLLEVVEIPESIEIHLAWSATSPGSTMFAMVNIPTTTAGKVLDLFSERSNSGSVCMRLPMEEIQPGFLSVMAHSGGAVNLDWTMHVTTVGGDVLLHANRGHMEVERGEAEERDALPCEAAEGA